MDYIYKIFGFKYEIGLSTRPENYLGDLELWDKSENMMKVTRFASFLHKTNSISLVETNKTIKDIFI